MADRRLACGCRNIRLLGRVGLAGSRAVEYHRAQEQEKHRRI
jgi:hypothetical protein